MIVLEQRAIFPAPGPLVPRYLTEGSKSNGEMATFAREGGTSRAENRLETFGRN